RSSALMLELFGGNRKAEVFPWRRKGPGAAIEGVDPEGSRQKRGIEPDAQLPLIGFVGIELRDRYHRPPPYAPQHRQGIIKRCLRQRKIAGGDAPLTSQGVIDHAPGLLRVHYLG